MQKLRQLLRRLYVVLFFALASSPAIAQAITPEPQSSLPSDLAGIPYNELLIALRGRVQAISARLSSISDQLMTSKAHTIQLGEMYLEQNKELGTSYAYSTSLSAEKTKLEGELATLKADYANAVRARDLWRATTVIAAGAAFGGLVGGPIGTAIGAGIGALASAIWTALE